MKLQTQWGLGLVLALGVAIAVAHEAWAQRQLPAGTETKTVAGILTWKFAREQGTKYMAVEIQASEMKYSVSGNFLSKIEETEPILTPLTGKRVTAYGQVLPTSPKDRTAYILVRAASDIAEQKPVDLTGTVVNEQTKDDKGKPTMRLMLEAGGKKYEVVSRPAQVKLSPLKGGPVKVKCYLDGGDDCLRIVEVVAAEAK